MEQFCQGDQGAFDALFERHAATVRGYLYKLTGSAAAADDLTQTTFLSVVRSRGRFRAGARFKPWLYAIASNAARDARRRGKFEAPTADGALPDEAVDAPQKDPGLEKQVRAALRSLPEAQAQAIVLHWFEGLSFAEIAEGADVTESAVKVRAHRGYQRLKELLGDVWKA